jgi:hypothetical protein
MQKTIEITHDNTIEWRSEVDGILNLRNNSILNDKLNDGYYIKELVNVAFVYTYCINDSLNFENKTMIISKDKKFPDDDLAINRGIMAFKIINKYYLLITRKSKYAPKPYCIHVTVNVESTDKPISIGENEHIIHRAIGENEHIIHRAMSKCFIDNLLNLEVITKTANEINNSNQYFNNAKEVTCVHDAFMEILTNHFNEIKLFYELRLVNMKLLKSRNNILENIINYYIYEQSGKSKNKNYNVTDIDLSKYIFDNNYFKCIKQIPIDLSDMTSHDIIPEGSPYILRSKSLIEKYRDYIIDEDNIMVILVARIRYGKEKYFALNKIYHLHDGCNKSLEIHLKIPKV